MKRSIFILWCLIMCIALSSCTLGTPADKKYVAVIMKSSNSDFFINLKNGVDSAATEYNVTVTFEGPENEEDYLSQNQMIEQAVENGADAILFSAIDYERSNDAVNNAVKKGVKVITIDSDISSDMTSGFIGTDNVAAGKAAAKAAINAAGESSAKIGLVNYTEATDNGKQREQGFRAAIEQSSGAQIVGSVTADSNVKSAKEGALRLLSEHPEINVLVGFNEWMTLGVGEAIKSMGSAGKIYGIGFDTNMTSVSMIETGEMTALIVQNPFSMGYLGVKNAEALISGSPMPEKIIYTDVTTVDKTNLFDEDVQKILFRFS